MIEQSISLERMEDTASLFGPFDENIRLIERELRRSDRHPGGRTAQFPEKRRQVMYAEKTIQSLLALGARGEAINEQNVRYRPPAGAPRTARRRSTSLARDVVCVTAAKESPSRPRRWGRTAYVRCHPK